MDKPKEDSIQTHITAEATASASGFEMQNAEVGAGFTAMLVLTTDMRPVFIDPMIPLQLGYTADESKTLDPFDLLANPLDRDTFNAEARAHGVARAFETSLRQKNGDVVPVNVDMQRVSIGGQMYLVGMLQSMNRCNLRQQQSDARYHLIFNNVPVGITISDMQGNFYAFNPAFNKMLGFSAAEFNDMKSENIYQHKEDRLRFVDILTRDKTVRNFETAFVRKDGRVMNVLLNSDVIGFGSLQNAMLSSVRDITPLKSIEAKLIQERNFTEAVLDTSDSLIMVFDCNGKMIRFNKACVKATGYSLTELQETSFIHLLSPDPQTARERIERMIQTRERETFENYWKAKNGNMLLIRWSSTVLKDEDGNDYIVSSGSDITERRKAHEAVRAANRELETSLRRLEERNQAISLLADMEGSLQGCKTVEEVCAVCARFAQGICTQTSGAVYLLGEDAGLMVMKETWGDETITERLFPPADCLSVQNGHMHLTDPRHQKAVCAHIRPAQSGQYLCIPMEANGKTLGVLHLSHICSIVDPGNPDDCPPYFHSKLRLLTTAAETAALSLSNIMLQETLRQQSIRDPLTGIYNRRYMVESLARELSRAQRENELISVLMLDIDNFKDFNDTYGHDGGDTLLRYLADYLRRNTRMEDIICRFGGEEFVVVLPNIRHQDAVQKAEVIRDGISALAVLHLGRLLHNCTVSIGVASYPHNGRTADSLLKAADEALYAAKRAGRNSVIACEL